MINVRDLVRQKGSRVYSVPPDVTVLDALKLMAEQNIGAVLVMQDARVIGILSERDCVRKLDLDGRTAMGTRVQDIMTRDVLYVNASQSLDECMALMIERNIRHLPVFENDSLIGVISIRDVLKEVVDYQQFMISQLEHYISGARP
jgi:CBS domain-containing protein